MTALPPGFLDDLPEEDQKAILDIVAKPIRFVGFDDFGQAELEFQEANGTLHFIYVESIFIQPVAED